MPTKTVTVEITVEELVPPEGFPGFLYSGHLLGEIDLSAGPDGFHYGWNITDVNEIATTANEDGGA